MAWRVVALNDIGRIVGGGTPSTTNSDYFGDDYPWITPKDLSHQSARFVSAGERGISNAGLAASSARVLPAGSVLISSRAPIGLTAIAQVPVTTNQGCRSFVPGPDTDSLFMYYLLGSMTDEFEQHANGSTFKEISGSTMGALKVRLPDLAEQRAIAAVLGALDDKIESNRRKSELSQALLRALYKSWFVEYSPWGGTVPKGWQEGKLRDVIDIIRDSTKAGMCPERPYVPIDTIPMHSLGLNGARPNSEAQSSLFLFETNDILLGAMRVYFHRVALAPFAGITRNTTFVLRPKVAEHLAFSLLTCDDDSTIAYAEATSKGSTMPYAVWDGGLAEMPLLIPATEVLVAFTERASALLNLVRDQIAETQRLIELRDSLLPELLSGRIRVPGEVAG